MTLKEKDFVEIEYTGKIENKVFDTTSEETAKKENIFNEKTTYGPIKICIGQNQVLKGIDESLIGKPSNDEFDVLITAEKAFGKKNPKLLKIVNTGIFKKQNIKPFPGLQVNVDGLIGTIKTVTGGRTIVDFNHPLSGHDLNYHIKINKTITDPEEKLSSLVEMSLNINKVKVEVKESKATVKLQFELPLQSKDNLTEKAKELIPEIKEINFEKTN